MSRMHTQLSQLIPTPTYKAASQPQHAQIETHSLAMSRKTSNENHTRPFPPNYLGIHRFCNVIHLSAAQLIG